METKIRQEINTDPPGSVSQNIFDRINSLYQTQQKETWDTTQNILFSSLQGDFKKALREATKELASQLAKKGIKQIVQMQMQTKESLTN